MITARGVSISKAILVTVLVLLGLVPVAGQSVWQGTAVVGRYGEFPPGGLFASSNSFPLNSMVDLTSTQSGRTVRVIVVGRVEEPGVFMVISDAVAEALAVPAGRGGIVMAEPVRMPGLTTVDPNMDLPFHPDPDVNPAATLGDPNRDIFPVAAGVEEVEETPEAAPPRVAQEPSPPVAPVPGTLPDTRELREPEAPQPDEPAPPSPEPPAGDPVPDPGRERTPIVSVPETDRKSVV